jgi:hypothetical protein
MIKLPFTKLMYTAVARAEVLKKPQFPNQNLAVGLFNDNTSSLPQMKVLLPSKANQVRPVINKKYEEGSMDTDRGSRTIQSTKDYYMGEVL